MKSVTFSKECFPYSYMLLLGLYNENFPTKLRSLFLIIMPIKWANVQSEKKNYQTGPVTDSLNKTQN